MVTENKYSHEKWLNDFRSNYIKKMSWTSLKYLDKYIKCFWYKTFPATNINKNTMDFFWNHQSEAKEENLWKQHNKYRHTAINVHIKENHKLPPEVSSW